VFGKGVRELEGGYDCRELVLSRSLEAGCENSGDERLEVSWCLQMKGPPKAKNRYPGIYPSKGRV
jgi:hypothetical protein